MATPWKHPETGAYYLYRQIPKALRPAFGGRQFEKKSLGTKCPDEARSLFTALNAELEQKFVTARAAMADEATRLQLTLEAANTYVARWRATVRDTGGETFWTTSAAQELGYRLTDATHGIPDDAWDETEDRSAATTIATGEQWLEFAARAPEQDMVSAGNSALCSIHEHANCAYSRSPHNDLVIIKAFNGAVRADIVRLRQSAQGPRRQSRNSPKPDMRLSELLSHWKGDRTPRPQTVHEAEGHIADLIDFLGLDEKIGSITRSDLYDYRDDAAKLPASMPRADRRLPFGKRVARHEVAASADSAESEDEREPKAPPKRISPTTLKKRMGSVAAVLGFACEKLWLPANVAHNIPIPNLKKGKSDRRSFRRGELKALFDCPLFLAPNHWQFDNVVSDCTLAWLFLIGLTTGARLEEMGSPLLANIIDDAGITIIDIDGQVKTEASRRVVPVHQLLKDCGFERFMDALRRAGAQRVFSDLTPSSFDKLTKEASRVANRLIDKHVTPDARLTFHSQRHTFKDAARKAGIIDSVADKICGHAPATVGGRYGDGADVETMYAAMMTIDLTMIDTKAIVRAWSSIDWNDLALRLVRLGSDNAQHAAELKAARSSR